jgi:hypothetical protein
MRQPLRFGRGGIPAILIVVSLVLLPVGYVLSTGPAFWLLEEGWLGSGTFDSMYSPVFALAESDRANNALWSYVEWWCPSLLEGPDEVNTPPPVLESHGEFNPTYPLPPYPERPAPQGESLQL